MATRGGVLSAFDEHFNPFESHLRPPKTDLDRISIFRYCYRAGQEGFGENRWLRAG
jgi:hypothetical protein